MQYVQHITENNEYLVKNIITGETKRLTEQDIIKMLNYGIAIYGTTVKDGKVFTRCYNNVQEIIDKYTTKIKLTGGSEVTLSGLESVKLPSTLYFLGRFAFTGCKSLTTVTAVFDDLGALSSYREPVSIYNLNNLHKEAEVNSLETIDERFEDCCTLKKIITTHKLYNKYFKLCSSCKDVEFELH